MDWTQVLVILGGNLGMFFWLRSESSADRRESHEDRKDMRGLISSIKEDLKDFHGRLCTLEERYLEFKTKGK